MRDRVASTLTSFGMIGFGVAAAVAAGASVDRIGLGPPPFAASLAVALVLAAIFAIKPAEGIGSFLLFVLFADNWEWWLGADLRLADEATVAAILVVGLFRGQFAVGAPRPGLKEAGLGLLLVAGVASSMVNGVPISIWGAAAILLFKAVTLFYIVSWLRLTIADVERVGIAIGAVALVVLGLGFVELLGPARFQAAFGLPEQIEVRGEISVVRSLFLHPSLFGWLALLASIFLYARLLVMRAWWALPLALAANVGIVLSARRTPVIGLLVVLAAALVWQLWRGRSRHLPAMAWLPVAGAVLLVAVVFRPALAGFYELTLFEYGATPGMVDEILAPAPDSDVIAPANPRIALYVASVAIARDEFPLGAGLGRFGSQMSRDQYSPVYAEYGLEKVPGLRESRPVAVTDSFWPMLLGEAGIIGLFGFALFIGLLLIQLWRAANGAVTPAWRAFALAAMLLFVESLVGSLTAATYAAPPIAYFVFAASGASLALMRPAARG